MVLEAGHGFTVVFPLYVQVPTAGKYWVLKEGSNSDTIIGVFHIFVNGESVSSVYSGEGGDMTLGPRSSDRWVDGHYRPNTEYSSFSTLSTNGLEPFRYYTEINLQAGVNRLVVAYTNESAYAYLATCRFNITPPGGDGSPLQYYSPKDLSGIEGKQVYQCIPALNSVSGLDEGSVKGAVYYIADLNYRLIRNGSSALCSPIPSCSYDVFNGDDGGRQPYPYPLKTAAGSLVSKNPWPRAYSPQAAGDIFSTCFNGGYFRGGTTGYPNTWWADFVSVPLPAWQYEVRASWFGFARGEVYQGGRWPVSATCLRALGLGGTATQLPSTSLPPGTFAWALTARTTAPDPLAPLAPSIAVTKPDWTASFTTVAGFASEARRMLITGTNLAQNVTVDSDTDYPSNTASNGFQISKDGVIWVDTLTFTPVSGVLNQSVYVRVSPANTNTSSAAATKNGEIVVRGGVAGFEFVEPVSAVIQTSGSGSPVGTTDPVEDIVKGNHIFYAVFPVYCWSDTARTAAVTLTKVDDYFYASVNGGSPYNVFTLFEQGNNLNIEMKAGWNKIVFVYGNNSWSGAYCFFDVAGVTSWWSPTADNLHNCVGKLVKDCLPDLTITTNNPLSAGLENNVKGIFYYRTKDRNDDLPPAFRKVAFPSFWGNSSRRIALISPDTWLPIEALQNFDYYFLHTNFRFYTDQRISSYPAPPGSVRWPIVQATKPSFGVVRFYVDMTAMITRGEFSNRDNKVQVRGTFSNWNSVFGWQVGSPYNSNVYVMEVSILATPGQQFSYKFYADGPGWELFTEDRQFTATGGEGLDLNLPMAFFNKLKDSGVFSGNQKLTEVRLGADPVTAIYYGEEIMEQVYP
jgi:hypothetical protein